MNQPTTKSNHIAERQQLMQHLQRIICYKLGWDADQFANHQYEVGLDYLHKLYGYDQVITSQLELSQIYWKWWRNLWLERDQRFVNGIGGKETRAELTESYLWEHNPRVLAGNIHPNSVVLNESYAAMIGEVIKKEVCK